MSILQKIKNQQEKSTNAHQKLIRGEYGLAKTFWLFWFIPIIIFSFIESYETTGKAIYLDAAMIFWGVTILRSIINIQAQKHWKIISMIVIVLDILLSLFAIVTYF